MTTLTKRMAEDLAEYIPELNVKVPLPALRDRDSGARRRSCATCARGVYDVVVGINLLREGLDLPEVSLVAILDADKEGFLRSDSSLIQIVGRAARHVEGSVIMYADNTTRSMRRAIDETNRRRAKQAEYNQEHGITPESIVRPVDMALAAVVEADYVTVPLDEVAEPNTPDQLQALVTSLETQMKEAAKRFEFEKAASFRDRVKALKEKAIVGSQ